ncbi:MAG: hypothetical protein KIS92_20125 [Planctomycetota bacterium]|nr:hypothetical protein [Planctomycetota bacterium]
MPIIIPGGSFDFGKVYAQTALQAQSLRDQEQANAARAALDNARLGLERQQAEEAAQARAAAQAYQQQQFDRGVFESDRGFQAAQDQNQFNRQRITAQDLEDARRYANTRSDIVDERTYRRGRDLLGDQRYDTERQTDTDRWNKRYDLDVQKISEDDKRRARGDRLAALKYGAEDAERAVNEYQDLATANPTAFNPDYFRSLVSKRDAAKAELTSVLNGETLAGIRPSVGEALANGLQSAVPIGISRPTATTPNDERASALIRSGLVGMPQGMTPTPAAQDRAQIYATTGGPGIPAQAASNDPQTDAMVAVLNDRVAKERAKQTQIESTNMRRSVEDAVGKLGPKLRGMSPDAAKKALGDFVQGSTGKPMDEQTADAVLRSFHPTYNRISEYQDSFSQLPPDERLKAIREEQQKLLTVVPAVKANGQPIFTTDRNGMRVQATETVAQSLDREGARSRDILDFLRQQEISTAQALTYSEAIREASARLGAEGLNGAPTQWNFTERQRDLANRALASRSDGFFRPLAQDWLDFYFRKPRRIEGRAPGVGSGVR